MNVRVLQCMLAGLFVLGIAVGCAKDQPVSNGMQAPLQTPVAAGSELYIMKSSSTGNMYLWVDPDTGCHYLSPYKGGVAPRISSDGRSHAGCKGVKP